MYQLFNFPPNRLRGTYLHPEWYNIEKGLDLILKTVHQYYSSHTFSVKSNHPLIKILYHFGSMDHLSIDQIYYEVGVRQANLSMALNMTSSIWEGDLFNGNFYGPGIKEVYIVTNESFNYDNFYKNWWKEASVSVLSHPLTNLMLDLPNGLNHTNETGIAVLNIDMVKLIIQYRAFREQERKYKEDNDAAQRTAMMFINMFVLPNMLASHMDNVLINRIRKLVFNEPIIEKKNNHPFYIKDWSKEVTAFQESIVVTLMDRNYNFSEMMISIPLIGKDNVLDFAPLPKTYRSRQVNWALMLARLDLLETLIRLNKLSNGNNNQTELNTIARMIQRYKTDNVLNTVLPNYIRSDIKPRLDILEREAKGY